MIQYIVPLLDGSLPIEYFLTPALGSFEALSNCIRQIDLVCADQTPGWQLAVKSSLFNFFFLLISERQKKTVSTSSNSKSLEKMKTVLKYVENHYTEKLTIDDMAELTYYSKSHFMKFFKAHMGIGFTEYLNDYRLTMAARLLKSSDDSILMIADASGFDNLSYFNRIFKRKYGISLGLTGKHSNYPETIMSDNTVRSDQSDQMDVLLPFSYSAHDVSISSPLLLYTQKEYTRSLFTFPIFSFVVLL